MLNDVIMLQHACIIIVKRQENMRSHITFFEMPDKMLTSHSRLRNYLLENGQYYPKTQP